ncbi:hypothetical protein [Desmospora profundinema]|uniref:Flp family type IVb pilin n=1 Tax=Desmospora profundinema TaxID=1571184 RepID=A0ABU1IQK2_9BACL|nr:hypothetical protein [Desmospora profundinema]MDR6227068.1 hypothetical protein [Desmospora profundinema]
MSKMKGFWEEAKDYIPNFRKPLASKKGSPTLEYVGILAAGALFAALLVAVFSDDDNTIFGELQDRVKKAITGGEDDS